MCLFKKCIHSHKKRKDSLEIRAVLLIFPLEFECQGWPYRAYIKTTKNGGFCEELLSKNDFEAVSATLCYNHGAVITKVQTLLR